MRHALAVVAGIVVAAVVAFMCGAAHADIIVLNTGQMMDGTIVLQDRLTITVRPEPVAGQPAATRGPAAGQPTVTVERKNIGRIIKADAHGAALPDPSAPAPKRWDPPLEPAAPAVVPPPPGSSYCVIPLHGEVGATILATALEKSLADAVARKPTVIVLDIDSPGGLTDEAESILKVLHRYNSQARIVALAGEDLSAAVIITLSVKEIYVKPTGRLGAATAFRMDKGNVPATLEEKFMSNWRAVARNSAQEGGHEPLLAEAMIDNKIELHLETVDGKTAVKEGPGDRMLCRKGNILTLTSREAVDCGLAAGIAEDLADLGKVLKMPGWTQVQGLGTLLAESLGKREEVFKARMDEIGHQFEKDFEAAAKNDPSAGEYLRQTVVSNPGAAPQPTYPPGMMPPGYIPGRPQTPTPGRPNVPGQMYGPFQPYAPMVPARPPGGTVTTYVDRVIPPETRARWKERSLACVVGLQQVERDLDSAGSLCDAFGRHATAGFIKELTSRLGAVRAEIYDSRNRFTGAAADAAAAANADAAARAAANAQAAARAQAEARAAAAKADADARAAAAAAQSPPPRMGAANPRPNGQSPTAGTPAGPPSPAVVATGTASPAAIQEAMKGVQEVYGADLRAATTPEKKSALAEKLLGAAGTESDAASRAALLTVAQTTAIQGGDLGLAISSIDAQAGQAATDAAKLKAEAATAVAKTLTLTPARLKFIEMAGGIIDEAAAADSFDIAGPLAQLSAAQARLAGDAAVVRDADARLQRIRDGEKLYAGAAKAMATLATKPADPAANLEAGKYRCFVKDDWPAGLPMLLLGNDAELTRLAQQELVGARTADEMVRIGDAWWDLGEKQAGPAKAGCQRHAAALYRDAMATLPAGLVRSRVEKRTQSVADQPAVGLAPGGGWTVLMRSADPSIWDKDVNRGANDFAVPLVKAPAGVQFLKVSIPGGQVIISMTNDRLGVRAAVGGGSYWWTGLTDFHKGGYHLGIYDKRVRTDSPNQVMGMAGVFAAPTNWESYSGWGFGGHVGYDDRQCYAWDGKEIQPTVFEISVKTGPLTAAEKRALLE